MTPEQRSINLGRLEPSSLLQNECLFVSGVATQIDTSTNHPCGENHTKKNAALKKVDGRVDVDLT